MKIIYDFGANVGNNIDYYLKKCDLIVAVEADPELCGIMRDRYDKLIEAGKLIVLNYVLVNNRNIGEVDFYINLHNRVLNQFPNPSETKFSEPDHDYFKPNNWKLIKVLAKRPSQIIKEYGDPHYVKIDVENYDAEILKDIFLEKIFPDFISAESHTLEVFETLLNLGKYNYFNLNDGSLVGHDHYITNIVIKKTNDKSDTYRFVTDSAGPFGEDIPFSWISKNDFREYLMLQGLGWKDIHATNIKL